MKSFSKLNLLITLVIASVLDLNARAYTPTPATVAFSALKGQQSKPQTLTIAVAYALKTRDIKITGPDNSNFKVASIAKTALANVVTLIFTAPADIAGIKHAQLSVSNHSGKVIQRFDLAGLATNGLEGENEPPLATIIDALGYKINAGWQTLANNSKPDLLGDEIGASLFKKAGNGMVEILPVARYSGDGEMPFGYYVDKKEVGKEHHQAGVLAKAGQYTEHQTLFPSLSSGSTMADPGTATFGFYTTDAIHSAFTEDVWNMLFYPDNAARAARVYPVKAHNGTLLKNTYLVCFEEGQNGDYNDVVFLVKNVIPVTDELFTTIFDGKSLNGWHSYLKGYGANNDPNKNFRLEDGTLHVIGKDLGYLISDKGFFNFHAKLQFKWGVTKWPPRENAKRDGGFLYNIPMAEPDSIWPKSIECQIQEGDVGDFWMLGFSTMSVKGKVNRPTNHIQFVKFKDNEKPYGEWNTVEVISYNGRCVQIVNGVVVNYGDNASVTGGRVILQSEYSEIWYRNVSIRQL